MYNNKFSLLYFRIRIIGTLKPMLIFIVNISFFNSMVAIVCGISATQVIVKLIYTGSFVIGVK